MEHLTLFVICFLFLILTFRLWFKHRKLIFVVGRIQNRSRLLLLSLIVLYIVCVLSDWQHESSKYVQDFSGHNEDSKYHTEAKYIPPEPIDVVYTWVNGTDERWRDEMARFTNSKLMEEKRYADNHELLYSLRSIEMYAPWIRHVYIVTNGQIPSWLNLNYPRVTVVPHSDIVPPEFVQDALPTFSSMAIEMWLHRIPNLSQRFLYLNDDIFLGRPMFLDDLRSERDGIYVVNAWNFDYCARTCNWRSIGNLKCDDGCNIAACNFDGGDCRRRIAGRREHIPAKDLLGEKAWVDHYLTSLIHTHGVLTARYGYKRRRTIAHVGFLIDRNIMYDIENIFPVDVKTTQLHRTRYGLDSLQYALLYHEVLLSEMREISNAEIFDEFDIDRDGIWTNQEIRNYLTFYHETDILETEHIVSFCTMMRSCLENNEYLSSVNPTAIDKIGCTGESWEIVILTREQVFSCPQFLSQARERVGKINKYKGSPHPSSVTQSAFMSTTTHLKNVKHDLNFLRYCNKLFICINNDISDSDNENYTAIIHALNDFYLSKFPSQSDFELPVGEHNYFRYVDEIRAWRMLEHILQFLALVGFLSCCVVVAFKVSRWKTRRVEKKNVAHENNLQYILHVREKQTFIEC